MGLYEIVCQTLENCKVCKIQRIFNQLKKNAQSPVSKETMSLQKRSVALRMSPECSQGSTGVAALAVEGRTPCWGRAKEVL